jgi:hypothetical protein
MKKPVIKLIAWALLILTGPSCGLAAELTTLETLVTPADQVPVQEKQIQQLFSDLDQTHPNYVAIKYLKEQGVLSGYPDGTFQPEKLVNRAEALKILLTASGTPLVNPSGASSFSDVKLSDWFMNYLATAQAAGIVQGNPDGTFAPERSVNRAEYLKMLLMLNGFKPEAWTGRQMFPDVPADAWFTPYLNYAGQAGLIIKDNGLLHPDLALSRGEVAEITYIMTIIRSGKNTQFLLTQTELQMAQIDVYMGNQNTMSAKRASGLAVDFSQQALLNMPSDNIVLSAAKLARAYDYLMNSYLSALRQDVTGSRSWADQAIQKATEAWEANNNIQLIAKHIKDLANEIISQLPTA